MMRGGSLSSKANRGRRGDNGRPPQGAIRGVYPLAAQKRRAKMDKIITALKAGNTRTDAYHYAGISGTVFYDWMKVDPEFYDQVIQAEAVAVVNHVTRIAQAAAEGNWQAAAWWLERRKPLEYGKASRLDVTVGEMSPDDIKRYIAERLGLAESHGTPGALPEPAIPGELAGGDGEGAEPLCEVSE